MVGPCILKVLSNLSNMTIKLQEMIHFRFEGRIIVQDSNKQRNSRNPMEMRKADICNDIADKGVLRKAEFQLADLESPRDIRRSFESSRVHEDHETSSQER